ncbi:hypothetical protein IV203_026094 [Nitzschia inconspicua]|uniref:Uncharacterized protein n=1 Tax=Nitzschia inconspicua TaxID=303405 RepID=A0A9K3LHX5_9STRA|nr:hypothetical protein IV203_026094 [Nitzschia inconspicua]
MVFSVVAATARRRIAYMAAHKTPFTNQCQRRAMGHGPAPEWEGIDKVVRGTFPHDHQLAMAIMGGYSALFVLYKIKSTVSKPKQGEPAVTPAAMAGEAPPGQGMPAIDSPEFGSFLETDRFTKMMESDDFGHIIEGTKA